MLLSMNLKVAVTMMLHKRLHSKFSIRPAVREELDFLWYEIQPSVAASQVHKVAVRVDVSKDNPSTLQVSCGIFGQTDSRGQRAWIADDSSNILLSLSDDLKPHIKVGLIVSSIFASLRALGFDLEDVASDLNA